MKLLIGVLSLFLILYACSDIKSSQIVVHDQFIYEYERGLNKYEVLVSELRGKSYAKSYQDKDYNRSLLRLQHYLKKAKFDFEKLKTESTKRNMEQFEEDYQKLEIVWRYLSMNYNNVYHGGISHEQSI